MAKKRLSDKHKKFIEEYLISWNATAAYQATYSRASYESARRLGSNLLTKPSIREVIDANLEDTAASASVEFEKIVRGYVKGKHKSTSAYVYFIRSSNGLTKIGIAKNVQSRLNTLNTASPIELSLLFYFEPKNAKHAEAALHKRFSLKRVKGEWFNLSDSDIAWVMVHYDVVESSL